MNLFDNLGLSQQLLATIKGFGHTEPTQIQSVSIPHIMNGKDVIGESATGSGKTLAFGCGIVEKTTQRGGVQALVITPTRELAEQVKESLKQLSYKKGLRIASIYGGVSISPQMDDIARAEVVVATPGRLLDHLQRRTIDLSKLKILVLDEADRMLDMGFIDDVKRIIKSCPKNRQTLFFSATIAPSIRDLARQYMSEPILVSGIRQVDPSKLKQIYYDASRNLKFPLLVHLLQNENSELVMVFCNTRRNTDFVVKNLKANGIRAIATHGGLSQNKRTNTISLFNDGKVGVLVCTDVASRGLHIDNVSHVYNYDLPKDAKDYVHRIGRTARAGEEGKVINILCDVDYDNFSRIQREYRGFKIERIQVPALKKVIVSSARSRGFQRGRPFGRGSFRNDRDNGSERRGRDFRPGSFRGRGSRSGSFQGGSSQFQRRKRF
ncbi:DEAD/DEAH box helicase [Candidatus Woesearchaeota archaeon]|nr:DEAD/DEAH box helicase [Candidatus Woesearchaeota archaeon]MBW3018455.1 DEAD/DEAH box helicase [Candidatus Woesearchaeota archaeon]